MSEYVLDIHSGGKTLEFLPFAAYHELDDKQQQARCEAAIRAFAAPWFVSPVSSPSLSTKAQNPTIAMELAASTSSANHPLAVPVTGPAANDLLGFRILREVMRQTQYVSP